MRPHSFWNLWKPCDRLWIGYGAVYCDSAHWNCSTSCSVCTPWHAKLPGQPLLVNYTCQVCRNKELHLPSLWLSVPSSAKWVAGQPSRQLPGPVCSPVRGEWEVRFLDNNSSCSPHAMVVIAFTGFLQESQHLPFPLFPIKGLCIQESPFFFSFLCYYLLLLTRLVVTLCI